MSMRFIDLKVSGDGDADLRWHNDTREWEVLADIVVTWRTGEIVIPAGFLCDLASIPRVARSIIPKTGRHNVPAIVHDFLYVNRWRSRDNSDVMLLELCKVCRVRWLRRSAIYRAVWLFGEKQWLDDD